MKKTTKALSITALLLGAATAALWLWPTAQRPADGSHSYGVSEGLQLVRETDGSLVVKDSTGTVAFAVPVRGCVIDTRFRDGRLRFREKATGREGYIDRKGNVAAITNSNTSKPLPLPLSKGEGTDYPQDMERLSAKKHIIPSPSESGKGKGSVGDSRGTGSVGQDRSMASPSPFGDGWGGAFASEAAKILQGKLDETDARRRRVILNYCEHFRAAYTTKDIDFLRQVFSDKALIIVGNVVKVKRGGDNGISADSRVTLTRHTKKDYLARLTKVFSLNKSIDVHFSNFRIMRHPTKDGIYGVTLRQHYKSDRYEDDGWLFLLWDFRNPSMPVIHVRTWQPAKTVGDEDDVIGIGDFNLE